MRYWMTLIVHFLILTIFVTRLTSLPNNEEASFELGEHEEPGDHSILPTDEESLFRLRDTMVLLLQGYMIMNLSEYLVTLVFITVSLLFYEKMHLQSKPKYLYRFIGCSWCYNIVTQLFGVSVIWNDLTIHLATHSE
jgi:uncharacterized membrane protein